MRNGSAKNLSMPMSIWKKNKERPSETSSQKVVKICFGKFETKIISELCLLDDKVIATGGGAILREENVRHLKKNGIIIFLDADVDTLYRRIHHDALTQQKRPSLTNRGAYEEIEYLLAYRRPLYDRMGDFVINTANLSQNDAANKIIAFLHTYVKDLRKG